MYQSYWQPRESLLARHDYQQEAVDYHVGTNKDFLRRHEEMARRAVDQGRIGLKEIAPRLLRRVADARNLRIAWDYLSRQGGQTPGPNGHSYDDLADPEVWSLLRALGAAIRSDHYRPGPEKRRQISKGPGRGDRTLTIRNIEDRVVERGIVQIIQPILDPCFDDRSLGYRPGLSRSHALALAEQITLRTNRFIWITEDLQDAFDCVPLRRLLDVVRMYVPAPDLVTLIDRVIFKKSGRGLSQGGPLSPLLTNVYLDHLLDKSWRRDHPRTPLVRVADDILVQCRWMDEAPTIRSELEKRLTPAGMKIKPVDDAIRRLDQGQAAKWLGFEILADKQGLIVQIGDKSWERLKEHLQIAHTKPDAPLRAIATIQGWISQLGPTFMFADRRRVCQRAASIAAEYGFDEIPSEQQLLDDWQRAHARWCKLRQRHTKKRIPALDTVSRATCS